MKKALAVATLLLVIIACSVDGNDAPSLEVGSTFSNSNVRVVNIDTLTVELSTFKFDSIVTSETQRLLVGQYSDEFFGTVRSETYMEFTPTTFTVDLDEVVIDSVGLILGYDNYFYSDTTKIATFNVHLISEEFDSEAETDLFYNTSKLAFEETPLTSISFHPEPVDEDSLYIPLPDTFGQMLYDSIRSTSFNSIDEFRSLFKGFTIQPAETDDASVLGFSFNQNNTYIRIFYSDDQEFEDVESNLDIGILNVSTDPSVFNRIVSNVEGTALDVLTDQEINLSSRDSEDKSFLQAGVGHATRIQFPTLKQIFNVYGNGDVLNATLELKPNSDSFNDLLPLRDSLNINLIDQNNVITEQVFFGTSPALARIDFSGLEFKDLRYEVPIGIYVDQELNEESLLDDAFVLFQQNYNQTVDRVVFEGEDSSDFKARLVITYAIYDDEEDD